jgi:hypothetical protein
MAISGSENLYHSRWSCFTAWWERREVRLAIFAILLHVFGLSGAIAVIGHASLHDEIGVPSGIVCFVSFFALLFLCIDGFARRRL